HERDFIGERCSEAPRRHFLQRAATRNALRELLGYLDVPKRTVAIHRDQYFARRLQTHCLSSPARGHCGFVPADSVRAIRAEVVTRKPQQIAPEYNPRSRLSNSRESRGKTICRSNIRRGSAPRDLCFSW